MDHAADALARWAVGYKPGGDDPTLAQRSLTDTLAVTVAARAEPVAAVVAEEPAPLRWAAVGHALDYDDLHLPSTAHISVVCVSATLAAGGGARAYLAGAGVMARLGGALGWGHYRSGWHATCTAGAPAAAVSAAVAMGLEADGVARAIALAVPAAGGVQRAFGTMAKPLQVGFATAAGVRAARLAADGATADVAALDDWLPLVGAAHDIDLAGSAVPGGLAIKLFPCCYALQRPIAALRGSRPVGADGVASIRLRTTEAAVQPLIHHRPRTGLEGKFSLEYGIAAALLDDPVGLGSFTDRAVARPAARRLVDLVRTELTGPGEGLLDGSFVAEIGARDHRAHRASLAVPPGSPDRPPSPEEMRTKVADCCGGVDGMTEAVLGADWGSAPDLLRRALAASPDPGGHAHSHLPSPGVRA